MFDMGKIEKAGRKAAVVLAALVLLLGGLLVAAGPAQALGWSAQRCDNQPGNYAKVCIQVHSVAYNNGLKVDGYQICTYHVNDGGNHFRGIKNSLVLFGPSYSDAPPNQSAGTCNLVNNYTSGKIGLNGCYTLSGTLDIAYWDDKSYSVSGAIQGGAC